MINLKRKLFHISFGTFLLILTYFLSKNLITGIILGFWIGLSIFEIIRLKNEKYLPFKFLWKPLFKPEEANRINDAWFFLLGVLFASLLLELEKLRAVIGILTYCDPLAAIIGGKFGRHKIRNKSVEGSLTFFLSAMVVSILFLKVLNLEVLLLCLTLSFVELLTRRDNLWIPLTASLFFRLY